MRANFRTVTFVVILLVIPEYNAQSVSEFGKQLADVEFMDSSTTAEMPNSFVDLSECGMTKSCYRSPVDCDMDCDYVVTWRMNGDLMIDFELEGTLEDDRAFVAMGLSLDRSMGDDSVVDCMLTENPEEPTKIQMSYNEHSHASVQHSNVLLTDPHLGLVPESLEARYEDGRLTCRFTRHVFTNTTSTPDDGFVYNFDVSYNLLVAKGPVQSGFKEHHGETKVLSPVMINFTGSIVDIAPPYIDLSDCGVGKSCYRNPAGCESDCSYVVTWKMNGTDMVDFQVEGTMYDEKQYIAIGLSLDQAMGDDSVVDCLYTGDQNQPVEIKMSFNEHNHVSIQHSNIPLTDQYLGLVEDSLKGYYSDGKLICTFTRLVTVKDSGSEDAHMVYDLDTPHYLLVAKGPLVEGMKQHHGETKVYTYEMLDFTAPAVNIEPPPYIDLRYCGEEKSCFRSPAGCETSCDYIVTWRMNGTDKIDFEVQGTLVDDKEYVAVGLSLDQAMGDDSVVDCIITQNATQPIEIQMSYNEHIHASIQHSNVLLIDQYLGLVEESREAFLSNGRLVCRFTRYISVQDSPSDEKKMVYDLHTPHYMLVSKGTVTSGWKEHHVDTKIISPAMVNCTGDMVDIGGLDEPAGTQVPIPFVDLSECLQTKSCYREPVDCVDDCQYIVTWKRNGDTMIDFEVEGTMGDSQEYIAIGMSKDEDMGDDSVIDCMFTGVGEQPVAVQMSYNEGSPESNMPLNDPTLGLMVDSLEAFLDEGKLVCRFTRMVSVDDPSTSEAEKVFDLSEPHHLLIAKGSVSSSFKSYHGDTKLVAPGLIDFTGHMIDIGGSISYPLIKAHGVLMILAWMVSASFAVLMPRYNKNSWPDKNWCGKPVWFQLHMPLMTCTFLLTVAGFIVIFVSVGGYAKYANLPEKVHPILGIITTALVVINPLMAACRPHPGTPRRPIFDGFHFTVGLLAHVCAVSSIFIAMYMPKANPPTWGKWVMVAFICWHTLIEIILAIHMHCCIEDKPMSKGQMYELSNPGSLTPLNETGKNTGSGVKTFLLVLHLLGVLGLSVALSVGICQN